MNIKEIFSLSSDGTLTYDEFMEFAKKEKANFTDLSEGKYVSKNKYDDDLKSRDTTIADLNGTISTRDADLAELKTKLETMGEDAGKVPTLMNDLTALQTKYDSDMKQYQEKLSKQAYEFAVKEYANGRKFTSNAAKRDFTQSMIAENLKFKDGQILGADDFVKVYTENNADAFVVDMPEEPEVPNPLPEFVATTPGGNPAPVDSNAFVNAFHFTGVR